MVNSTSKTTFPSLCRLPVVCSFTGGEVTSDAGILHFAQIDAKLGLSARIANAIVDVRSNGKVRHSKQNVISSRLFAIVAGYEDGNDFDKLCKDPGFLVACGNKLGCNLASQPTISRFENRLIPKDLICMAEAIAWTVVEQLPSNTRSIVIDVDATDDLCYGQQEFKSFNKYYRGNCYLPHYMYVTGDDGVQRLMATVLRPGNSRVTKGLFFMLKRGIALIRERFPDASIEFRADSAYGHDAVVAFCESRDVKYTVGLPRNPCLYNKIADVATEIQIVYATTGLDQTKYIAFPYKAGRWKQPRQVIAKIETVSGNLNVRYLLTSNTETSAEDVYKFYRKRGDIENRIKEMKIDLSAGRTSAQRFWTNQYRLLLHLAANVLWRAVQDALRGTMYSGMQIGTLRSKIVKIGARIKTTYRNISVLLPTNCPYKELWNHLHGAFT